jgi:pyridoxine kinase
MKLHKLALIHAISGFGHSTMSVILPVVSAMGVQGCPLPTAIFSNHTGFPDWYKLDFTDHMMPYLEAWDNLDLAFDGIYSGYLGSGTQCQAVLALVEKHPEALFFLDPVMGDHGKLYSAITPEHVTAMKKLVTHAAYLLPNITEACVLTDTPYEEDFSQDALTAIAAKLHALGPSHIVMTGLQ